MKDMKALPLADNKIIGGFWRQRIDNVIHDVIPYQWKALNDQIPGAEPSHSIENFRIASGQSTGTFYGLIFQDSDVGKWIEAASYGLTDRRDAELEAIIDGVIELIGQSQEADGYLDTYFSMAAPDKKWTDFAMGHEMYCGGHLMEGAIAYYQATGKRSFLDIMIRYADHLDRHFGKGPEKIVAYCGHPEIELALWRLFDLTGENRYANLATFFVEERGRHPEVLDNRKVIHWGGIGPVGPANNPWHQADYYQDHAPVREQVHADGHSVRAMYLFCAMADQWRQSGDASLGKALERLWDDTVNRRMYVTGGIGSQAVSERFTIDYDLPSDTAYAETCASIGLIFWAWRMTLASPRREYADTLERSLYNGALSGISLDGTRYFYVNPLEVVPAVAHARQDHDHVKTERVQWFGCSCCPPNIARLVCSVAQFQYSYDETGIWVHQYVASTAGFGSPQGPLRIEQSGDYPWQGDIRLRLVEVPGQHDLTIRLRLPDHAGQARLTVNGTVIKPVMSHGYAEVSRRWEAGDVIRLEFDLPIRILRSHPKVRETSGLVAVQRGPLVYCIEEVDNGPDLHLLRIDPEAPMTTEPATGIGNGVLAIRAQGWRVQTNDEGSLYSTEAERRIPCDVVLVPYYAWGNRGLGEMRVWLATR